MDESYDPSKMEITALKVILKLFPGFMKINLLFCGLIV
jgi:hypothetical protein